MMVWGVTGVHAEATHRKQKKVHPRKKKRSRKHNGKRRNTQRSKRKGESIKNKSWSVGVEGDKKRKVQSVRFTFS